MRDSTALGEGKGSRRPEAMPVAVLTGVGCGFVTLVARLPSVPDEPFAWSGSFLLACAIGAVAGPACTFLLCREPGRRS